MNRELLAAARQGSLFRVNKLIKQGANVNYGMCGAAKDGHKELVDFFVKKGANDWNNGMRYAAKCGHKELVDLFIKNGANNWNWGMYSAVEGGHKELVDLFIKNGANAWNDGMRCSAKNGHKELVDLFIKRGANDWNNGMYGAAQGGHKELVDLFVKKGANNWNGGMCNATNCGHKDIVDLFIKNGANDWNGGLRWSTTTSLKIFFIDKGANVRDYFPQFYKEICVKFHLSNGVLVSKLLRRYIARFKGSKLRNEKVIINDKHETTLDQVFISPPGTIVKFRNVDYQIKGYLFYLIKSRNPHFK